MFCVFNIESKSLRQLFYTHNPIIEPLILQKHQTGNIKQETSRLSSTKLKRTGFVLTST